MSASLRQRGFTLIEALVVVLIIGLIAAIATTQINKAWQKTRLEATSQDVRSFLQSAYTYMVNSRAPVFVRFVPDSSSPPKVTIEIRDNPGAAGTLFSSYAVPDFANLSATVAGGIDCNWPTAAGWPSPAPSGSAPGILECDTSGRAVNGFDGTMAPSPQTLVLTHDDMLAGTLTPKIVYTIQLFPLWQVQVLKTVS